ncbi:hypothetical protein ABZ942_35060 [Nocardia sp. NPDC046473]|uniref:hypothetical protein n=1 Tax=Nocardia sp. NPDC046473 TaxID=3155733 RepID=UPI0033C2BFDB
MFQEREIDDPPGLVFPSLGIAEQIALVDLRIRGLVRICCGGQHDEQFSQRDTVVGVRLYQSCDVPRQARQADHLA